MAMVSAGEAPLSVFFRRGRIRVAAVLIALMLPGASLQAAVAPTGRSAAPARSAVQVRPASQAKPADQAKPAMQAK
ncbi:hypothetical protein RSW14_25320, partial [Escherichia coli]|nr:hypothetical protein [Escherichia coli]